MKQLDLGLLEPPQRRRTAAMEHYHVRSHTTVAEALESEEKAEKQEDAILLWFGCGIDQRSRYWTPSEVATVFPQWPLTSIRRALTNLTTKGLLIHHKADRRPGPFGAKESTWSLA